MHEVHRWNQSSFLVPAIPTWKFFIFGGEQAEYQEGTARAFGQYVNTSAILDLGTMRWTTFASDEATYSNIPSAREYCAMSYDGRERRLVIFGGWNNGWYDDLYTLNVSKIVGPPYAIVNSDPAMGQLSGGVELEISGRGFSENQITVLFTQGDKPVDAVGKMTKQVPGTFKDATTITCVTPNFDDFGPKQCIMQLQIGTQDITTTWVPFQYFLDTKASKSLVYGPGILHDNLVSHETEFVIVARNELNENRTSGRDKYIVKLKTEIPKPEDYDEEANGPYRVKYDSIDVPVEDNQDGTYKVKYTFDDEKEVEVHVYLMVKEEQVAIRGSPYKASFNSTAKPADNTLAGPLMQSHFKQQMSDLMDYMTKKDKSIATKGKDLQQVPVLLGVKEEVEDVFKNEGITTLKIDQLDESIKMFGAAVPKVKVDSSKFGKIVTNWNNVKNNSKNTQK
jgi:dynein heavy chain